MERLGDWYLIGAPLGGTAAEQVFVGALAESGGEPGSAVTVRMVDPGLATLPGTVDQLREFVNRVRGIGGPNLAAVHDVVVDGERVALVTDPLPPTTLRDWLDHSGPLYPALVAQLGAEIASALEILHGKGVLHLALSPENVRFDGTATVTGQGVGVVRVNAGPAGRDAAASAMPQYVAPEVIRGEPLGYGTDMYALGVLLYEACCGVPPFVGRLTEVLAAHQDLRPGVLKDVPPALREVIEALLAKEPTARPDARTTRIRLADLAGQLSGIGAAAARQAPPAPVHIPLPGVHMAKRRRRTRVVIAVTSVVVAAAATLFFVSGTGSEPVASDGGATPGPGTSQQEAGPAVDPTTSASQRVTVMPDLVGTDLADARTRLPSGVDIETVPVTGDEDEDGVIKGQEPAAGEPIGDVVRLTVVRPLVPVQLDTQEPVDGEWDNSGVATMDGKQFLHSLSSTVGACSPERGYVEYNLGRGFRALRAHAGIEDGTENDKVVLELEILGDDRPLGQFTVAYGKPVPVEVDVAEVLRLRIQWQVMSNVDDVGCDYATMSLGDPRLDGFAEQLPSSSGVPTTSTELTPTS